MILLLLDTGIRLSELIGLQMDDIGFIQSFILVKGKGAESSLFVSRIIM